MKTTFYSNYLLFRQEDGGRSEEAALVAGEAATRTDGERELDRRTDGQTDILYIHTIYTTL